MDAKHIGARIREIRNSRNMSLQAVAGLAGFSAGYLSKIERGLVPLERRSTLEALANALRIAPSELAAIPWPASNELASEARAAVGLVEAAVADFRLGDEVEMAPRPWPDIPADLRRLKTDLRPRADYAALGLMLPGLIEELHATYNTDPDHRTEALIGLATCYDAAAAVGKAMGAHGLALLAAWQEMAVAERLGRPEWIAHATWRRVHMIGSIDRGRQVSQANRALSAMDAETGSPEVAQAVGQLHLTASLACASMGRRDDMWAHFREAETLAERLGVDAGTFGGMMFGRTNVGIWRVALAVELGEGAKVTELAEGMRIKAVWPVRQAEFYADFGRALAQDRATREQAVSVLRRAEDLAPQRVRNMPSVRETVISLLHHIRRGPVGRELRGLAWRMGITG